MLTAIDRYLARLIALPLLGTLVIAAMLLVLDKMLSLFDFVAAEGGPVSVVWRMLANMLPEYLSLGIPIGLMLGILLAFRKLATSSELDVMRAVGLSYGRLLRVPYMFAFALALLNLGIVGWVQPLSRHAYEALRFELRSGALGASIKVGEFTSLGKRMTLRIERSLDEGRNLRGIFVRAVGKDGQSVAVTAAQGAFLATDDPDTIIFRLRDGVLVNDAPKYKTPRILSFSSHDLPIDLPQIENFRGRDVDREKTIPELMVIGRSPATPDKLKAEGVKVTEFIPKEGAEGWMDSWMVVKDTPNKECAYKFLNMQLSELGQCGVANVNGYSVANAAAAKACMPAEQYAAHRRDQAVSARTRQRADALIEAYRKSGTIDDLVAARDYLQKNNQDGTLDEVASSLEGLCRERFNQGIRKGDSFYAAGNYPQAEKIWLEVSPLYPGDSELSGKIDRVRRVLGNLQNLKR